MILGALWPCAVGSGKKLVRIRLTSWRARKMADGDNFDCGKEPLNRFLIRHTLQAQLSNASQTYVAILDR